VLIADYEIHRFKARDPIFVKKIDTLKENNPRKFQYNMIKQTAAKIGEKGRLKTNAWI